MKNERSDRGFTMMEMLIAVAILVILMGLGFVAVQNYQKRMKQLELDETAREIYIAAQNHLSVAKSRGILEKRVPSKLGEIHEEKSGGKLVSKHYLYYIINTSDTVYPLLSDSEALLHDMLPHFSIDDTVRANGNYVIEYDFASATIVNVFYNDKSSVAGTVVFSDSDYNNLMACANSGASDQRLNFNNTGKIIGWYGGEDLKGVDRTKLYAPSIEIINEEQLVARVSYPMNTLRIMNSYPDADVDIKVYIRAYRKDADNHVIDTESQLAKTIKLADFLAGKVDTTKNPFALYQDVVLDDVTSDGSVDPERDHFYKKWTIGKENPIYPGEDFAIYAEASSNKVLSNIARSQERTDNSIFGKGTSGGTADIRNIRHLENLYPSISGYKAAKLDEANRITKAEQNDDLDWSEFKNAISSSSPDSVSVSYVSGSTPKTVDGTYAPVNPTEQDATTSYLTSYDGKGHSITGVKIQQDGGYAGVFGAINAGAGGMTIKDLSIVNININVPEGGTLPEVAGGLAGMLKEVKVSGVVVYNDVEKLPDGTTDDSSIGIKASAAAGGLAGHTAGGSVDSSAAAVYVNASGNNSIAGGLIGFAQDSVTITNSYAGGHTENGVYDTENYNVTASVPDTTKISYAGGLIGTLAGPTVSNCYATTSAYASDAAGGLIGNWVSGVIKNCYATGLVGGAADSGAFVGKAGKSDLGEIGGNYYLSLINNELSAIGDKEGDVAGIIAMDKDTETYANAVGKLTAAKPYDKLLKDEFKSMYPYKIIAELNPGTKVGLAATICGSHYGDWPAVETLVVNQKSNS